MRHAVKTAVCIATYGDPSWAKMARDRAVPSAMGQGAYDVLCGHHPEGPISAARNSLAEDTEAEWLCFLDADDELSPGYLSAMQKALESHHEASRGLARSGGARSGEPRHGEVPRAFEQEGGDSITTALLLTPPVQILRMNGMKKGRPVFFDRGIPLTDDNWLIVGTLIQRDLFLEVGGFSDYPHGFEDWSLWAKAWKAGAEIVKVPDAIYRYWINPRSKHKLGWRDREWQVATHNKIRAELFPELV